MQETSRSRQQVEISNNFRALQLRRPESTATVNSYTADHHFCMNNQGENILSYSKANVEDSYNALNQATQFTSAKFNNSKLPLHHY
jgi:hypothetical protein